LLRRSLGENRCWVKNLAVQACRKSNQAMDSRERAWQGMDRPPEMKRSSKSSEKHWSRLAAGLVCLALLYFAAGGSLLHQHTNGTNGRDTVCHVCQSLHAPALTVSSSGLITTPEIEGWHEAPPVAAHAPNEDSLYHSGRAPPLA